MTTIIIEYNTSVFTPSGWKGIEVTALAEKTSEKMAIVKKVLEVNGEIPRYKQSRTGSRRQIFNGLSIAKREINAKKRLSSCTIVE